MEIDYYEMILLLVRRRHLIIWITIIFTVAALVTSLIIPVRYKATAVLMPPVTQSTNLMSLITRGNIMSDPELGGTGILPGVISPSDIFAVMLKSGVVKSRVIEDCKLVEHYKQDKTYTKIPQKAMYNVAKILSKNTDIRVTTERFITITVEDKNREKAAEIANSYVSSLDNVYSKITMSQGGNMREFLGNRLSQEEKTLTALEESLRVFQERHRTVSITDEMKAVIEMAGELEAKIISQQIERDALKAYLSPENIQVQVLEKKIDVARKELDDLMKGKTSKALFVPFTKAPGIGLQLSRLMRDVKIHQEVYALLVQQFEQAKIIEAKDTPRIQFLEKAEPPFKKSWPKRSIIVLSGLILGLMSSILFVIGNSYLIRYLRDGDGERLVKLDYFIRKKM